MNIKRIIGISVLSALLAASASSAAVKINFPTAGASGALYAVGAAITNNWTKNVPDVQAASQASAGGIANLNDGRAVLSRDVVFKGEPVGDDGMETADKLFRKRLFRALHVPEKVIKVPEVCYLPLCL